MEEGEDEDQVLQKLMRVDDYTDEEIQEDINLVDWDFAYNEILKLEEKKKVKYTMEADRRAQQEKIKLEEDLRIQYEEEQNRKMEEVNKKMEDQQKKLEESNKQLEMIES